MTKARLLGDDEVAAKRPPRTRGARAATLTAQPTPADEPVVTAVAETSEAVKPPTRARTRTPATPSSNGLVAATDTAPVQLSAQEPVATPPARPTRSRKSNTATPPAETPAMEPISPRESPMLHSAVESPVAKPLSSPEPAAPTAVAEVPAAKQMPAQEPVVLNATAAMPEAKPMSSEESVASNSITEPPPVKRASARKRVSAVSAVESPASESVQVPKPEQLSAVGESSSGESVAGSVQEAPPTRPVRRTTRRAVAETPVQLTLDGGSPEPQAATASPAVDSSPVISSEGAPPPVAEVPVQPRPAARRGRVKETSAAPPITAIDAEPSSAASPLAATASLSVEVIAPLENVGSTSAEAAPAGESTTDTAIPPTEQNSPFVPRPQIGQRPVTFRPQGSPPLRGPAGVPNRPINSTSRPNVPPLNQGQGQGLNDPNGLADGGRGRRRRRRRGRGVPPVLNGGPTLSAPVAPPPIAQTFEEPVRPREFIPQPRMPVFEVHGILDGLPNGEAFLREDNLRVRSDDPLISVRDMRRFDLRNGDSVELEARPGRGRGPVLVERVITLNDKPYDEHYRRPRFEDLTPVYPDRMIKLETGQQPITTRMLDMIAPIGFGQRALIVSPPKAGKTTILKHIGQGVLTNYPEAKLILCLVGERPEEVTDLRMSLPKAIMFASSFDEEVERHGHLAEMALERAKRLAESGKDVVVLLDSVTRLARAYNLGPNSGGSRTLSGGMDASALTTARRIFGNARAIEQGGSLTIIATCLIDTGSRLDDVVYEEFKGTGNMELHLDRSLAEKRIFPAFDITRSSTRKEELLLDPETLKWVVLLRRRLASTQAGAATEQFIDRLGKTPSNKVFLELLSRAVS